jgi:uncharacterized membrane protein
MTEEQNNDQEALAIAQERKWSTSKFVIGIVKIICRLSTVAWAVYTFIVWVILQRMFAAQAADLNSYLRSPVMIILASGWVIVTFVMACDLQKAFSTAISNAKIIAEFKAAAELKGIVDWSKIVESVRK